VDSSALVKLVVAEPESDPLRRALGDDPDQVASAIAEVEVVRAVRRAAPGLVPRAQRVVAQLSVVEVTGPIRARAASLDPSALRSLDALHLATALEIQDELDAVVTYDARLAAAAAAAGLAVLAPR
jgi:predicted nucleic acid-binding protein